MAVLACTELPMVPVTAGMFDVEGREGHVPGLRLVDPAELLADALLDAAAASAGQ